MSLQVRVTVIGSPCLISITRCCIQWKCTTSALPCSYSEFPLLNMISVIEFRRYYFWSDILLTPHWLEALANLWGRWSSSLYLCEQCWHGLQQMFHCTRCCWMSAPSGCSIPQQSQRERVEQWVFWDLCLCSRSGRYAYHQTDDGVVVCRKSQWSKYSQNPRPGSRLSGGTCCCNNQRWGNVSIVSSSRFIMSECE